MLKSLPATELDVKPSFGKWKSVRRLKRPLVELRVKAGRKFVVPLLKLINLSLKLLLRLIPSRKIVFVAVAALLKSRRRKK